jgi:hypothetical protein
MVSSCANSPKQQITGVIRDRDESSGENRTDYIHSHKTDIILDSALMTDCTTSLLINESDKCLIVVRYVLVIVGSI